MPKFILIDHSLHRPGGHHFDYAFQVLSAAQARGYKIVVAANRRCPGKLMAHEWQILPLFRHHTYTKHSVLSGKSVEPRNPFAKNPKAAASDHHAAPSLIERLRQVWLEWDQRARSLRFAGSCERLFQSISLQSDDLVFFPTISDFDLVGLTLFLRRFPLRSRVSWHAQFHFNFLQGSRRKYSEQTDRLERMSQHFRRLLAGLDGVRLHFYATTPQLVEQYNMLHAAPFDLLNYPVNPMFFGERASNRSEGPLRVLCAGGLREEKGSHELTHLIEQMKSLGYGADRLQFWVQAKRPSRVPIEKSNRFTLASLDEPAPATAQVVCVPHPLGPQDYLRLLRSAHIGLFLYDSERYYTRCSGILVELLTAGVPVIVPAGCWLGEQLHHPAACGVGLVAQQRSDFPRLLSEMAVRYENYATAARGFAPRYFDMHRPEEVVCALENASRESVQRGAA